MYLPPALILATQFLMHLFAGMVGVMLATPLMVVAMVLIKELYFKQEWTEPAEEAAVRLALVGAVCDRAQVLKRGENVRS